LAIAVSTTFAELLAAAPSTGCRSVATGVPGIVQRSSPGFWIPVFRAFAHAAGGLFRNGGPAGAAGPVKVILFFAGRNPASAGVLVLETVDIPFSIPVPPKLSPTATAQWLGLLIVKKGGAARLFSGDAPQSDAFVSEKNSGSREKELAELKNRVESPALEE
jgi:hypothetical protein